MATHVSHSALPYPIKNARYTLEAPFLDADGDPTDPTTPDTEVSQDGGAYADAAEEVTTISGSNGSGYVTLTGAETNNSLVFVAYKVASGPKATLATVKPRNLAIVGSGTLSAGSAGGGTLGTLLAYDVTGCFLRTTGGTGGGGTGGANNQARRIITYNTSTGAFTVSPNWETTPSTDTTYDVLLPEGVTLGMLQTLNPTTAGRKLDVSSGGEAGVDWANVGSPTTTVDLSGTTIAITQRVDLNTIKTQTVTCSGGVTIPAATLASTTNITAAAGCAVSSIGSAVITATSIASDAITAAKIADGAIDAATFAAGAIDASAIAADAIGSSELAASAVAEIADQVWDEILSGHAVSGSTGEALSAAGGAGDPWITSLPGSYTAGQAGYIVGALTAAGIRSYLGLASANLDTQLLGIYPAITGAIASPRSTTICGTDLTLTSDDELNDRIIVFTGGALAGESRVITDFAVSGGLITFDEPLTGTPANLDTFKVISAHEHSKTQIENAVLDAATSSHTTSGTVGKAIADALADTNELQTDWANGGRLDLLLDTTISQTTESAIRTAVGLASANLDTQLDALPTAAENATAVLTTQMTESYRGTNAAPTLAQAQFELIAHMGESSISSTTKTLKKLDGSTTAKTYTLDSATTPTSITETT